MYFVIIIILTYLAVVYIGLRLVVPHLGFVQQPLPDHLPKYIQEEIDELKSRSSNQLEYLKNAYAYVTSQYYGRRIETVILFWYAFENIEQYKPGYLPCTSLNYLLRILLVKGGQFQDEDIQVITVPLNFFIHQYIRVRVNNEWIPVDTWGYHLGIPFGKYAYMFALGRNKPL